MLPCPSQLLVRQADGGDMTTGALEIRRQCAPATTDFKDLVRIADTLGQSLPFALLPGLKSIIADLECRRIAHGRIEPCLIEIVAEIVMRRDIFLRPDMCVTIDQMRQF